MPLRICSIASEVVPLAKTGGLADVAGALTRSLHAAGHDVRLFMPLYSQVDRSGLVIEPVPQLRGIQLVLGTHTLSFDVLRSALPGSDAPLYLVDAPSLYGRQRLYTSDAD